MSSAAGSPASPVSAQRAIVEGVRQALRESLFFPEPFAERVDLRYRPGFGTACWLYQPPHKVYVGLGLLDSRSVRKGLSEEARARYAANYFHHEMGHARFTDRRGKVFGELLKRAGVPFGLYNLFEDARIEHLYRLSTGYRFNWLTYERGSYSRTSATAVYFSFIQAEGPTSPPASAHPKHGRIAGYFERSQACTSSHALLPLLVEWVREFGAPAEGEGDNGSESDLSVGLDGSAEALAELDESSVGEAELAAAEGRGPSSPLEGGLLGAGGVLANARPDVERAARLAELLSSWFIRQKHRVVQLAPTRKIGIKEFIRGDQRVFKAQRLQKSRPKRVLLVLDCSGSMKGVPMAEARILLSALSTLAKGHHLQVTVLLSAQLLKDEAPRYQELVLPVDDQVLAQIHAIGCSEALQPTLAANLRTIQWADEILVYTDANITDEPINKAQLHKWGAYTKGLYVGDSSALPALLNHFDRALVRDSVEDLAMALIQNE